MRSGRLRIVEIADRRSAAPSDRRGAAASDAGDPLGATAAFLALLHEMRPELQAAASAKAT